mmetsp:Transcript_42946/g.55181  ORF Transcript_42946/g.55181 Transcript_42946/m.55181 type:complete len:435 (-) Transcript_42946:261-1565(-)
MADWFTSFTEDEAKNDASKNDTVEKKEPSTSGGEDNWFDKFESTSAEKGEGEGEGNDDEEDSSWIDMPLEWMTGRKSRGLSLEMYDHEHHLFELAHEGVVVISEEGIHAAYEHLTHDALLAIAKAHIRFGIVEVHDYDENDPRPFSMANKSDSGRKIQRSSYNLLEDDRKPEDFVKRKKKRMTTAEINDEAEKLVQQWEKNGAGDSGDSSHSSSVPGWFYGHIERLGFVPASKLVKEPKNDKKHFKRGIHAGIEEEDEDFDDDGEEKDGEGDQGHSFEKGHSVSLVDPTHEKIPQGTEGTILMLLKDSGKIIPSGTIVLVPFGIMARDEEVFEDPNTFKPERFENITQSHSSAKHGYLPFGYGSRTCIGNTLALTEGSIMIALLMQRYRFMPVSNFKPQVIAGISLISKNGIKIRVEADSDGGASTTAPSSGQP